MRLPPPKKARAALLFGALVAIEAAPVSAWLVVYAAAESGDIRLTAAPFWLIVGILDIFALARWRVKRLRPLLIGVALVACWVISLLALINLSPLAYVASSASPSSLWGQGALSSSESLDTIINFGLLTVYLGWRGIALGGGAPPFSRVTRRFSISMATLTLAIFGGLASAPGSAASVVSALLALTLLEGLSGLTAMALSHPVAGSGRTDAIMPGVEYSFRWQVTALLIALAIVVSAALVGGALDMSPIRALFAWLQPVTSELDRFGSWLTQSLAYILFVLTVSWLSLLIPKNLMNPPIHRPTPPVDNNHLHHQVVPPEFVAGISLIIGALTAIVVIALLYIAARLILKALSKPIVEELEEERERLDASSLLRQQAREFLDRWRHTGDRATARDELRHGSVRWLYRELLRAGARAGYERQPSETADEYASRLAEALVGAGPSPSEPGGDDVRALAHAYDDARYGSTDDDPPASRQVAEQSRRAAQLVGSLGAQPAHPRS